MAMPHKMRRSVPAKVAALNLFDDRPIPLDGFKLCARRIEAVGRPSPEQWGAAMDFATSSTESGPFWVGALWNYAEGRNDWRDRLEQMLADIGRPLAHQTLLNLGYVNRNVVPKAQELAPTISHAKEVAALDPDEQIVWMQKARDEEMTVRDLKMGIRASQRRKVVVGQAAEMHTVEVTVRLSCEAASEHFAEQAAWSKVKEAIRNIGHAHVIAAHARPYIQAVRHRKRAAGE